MAKYKVMHTVQESAQYEDTIEAISVVHHEDGFVEFLDAVEMPVFGSCEVIHYIRVPDEPATKSNKE